MDRVTVSAMQEPSYSLREAAERLGVSPRSVRRYVHSGQLAAVQAIGLHGPEYRVPESVLTAYVARVARVPMARVWPGGATVDMSTVDTLAIVATQLDAERSATREAWLRAEAAWGRVAELESELATLRATLPASTTPRRSLWERFRSR